MRNCVIIHPLHLELETATLYLAGKPRLIHYRVSIMQYRLGDYGDSIFSSDNLDAPHEGVVVRVQPATIPS
jgi:hypothetical protein